MDKDTEKELDRLCKRVSNIEADMTTKVNWKHFTWLISTIIGLQIIVMGAIWTQVKENGEIINSVNIEISNMSGILKGAEIID